MNDSDWREELAKLLEQVDYRAELNRVRVSRVYEEVKALKSKVHILEGKALDKEQDLALNKLGQMRETRQEAIKRALNEGYNDGFKDGFKEGERYRRDV
jgi:flagellar biosynthesis/type III secretory pathway protein FliH